jgi:ketosteroid isomerase-like protein
MRRFCLFAVFFLTPIAAMAQSPVCSDQGIRTAVQNNSIQYTEDNWFWSGAFEKPMVGKAEQQKIRKEVETQQPRKNQSSSDTPQRIVVSANGDMAYEYGNGTLSYDDQKEGKHVAFEVGYLRVWKAVDGQCKIAAFMIRPIESTIKETPIKPN